MRIDQLDVADIAAIPNHDEKMLAAAVWYASQGFYIVPIRPNGKAIPGKSYNFNYSHASRNEKVVAKWYGDGGKFQGWNIGLATGRRGGIFAVDIDMHGEVNGLEEFNGVVPEGFRHTGPVQRTPNGGLHLIMEWGHNCRSSTGKIARGVDTRGGEEDSCKGHIVAWPSTVDGKEYEWDQFGEVEEVPDFIMDRMGTGPIRRPSEGARGNEYISSDDLEEKFSLDQIQTMLDAIDPNELTYDDWLQVGQAIHSQHSDGTGLRLWDQWSQRDTSKGSDGKPRYGSHVCSGRWAGFDAAGSVRIGTLIFFARQRGWDLSQAVPDPNADRIDTLVAELNEKYAVLPMGSDVMVLEDGIDVPEEFRRIQPTWRLFKKTAFRSLLENRFEVSVDPKSGKVGKTPVADIWLAHEERRTYPAGLGMFPNKPQRYQGYYNMWQGLSVEPTPGDWSLFKNHVREIVCDGDEELFEWVLDWVADLYQDPSNPKGCAIVLHGIEGCGKGTFAEMLGSPFGTAYKHITSEEHLVGRFNAHLADTIFLFADEVVYGGNRKVAGQLKALVTERYITAERKGVDAIQFHNCTHLVVASNEDWFIPAGPQSRRWLVLDVSGKRANDREYFNSIHTQMDNGGLAGMLHELLGREITRDLRKAPETDALQIQRAQYAATDSVNDWWSYQLNRGKMFVSDIRAEHKGWPEKVMKSDLIDHYRMWCNEHRRKTVSDSAFWGKVLNFGFERVRFKLPNQQRAYGYKVPDLPAAIYLAQFVGIRVEKDYED